MAQINILLFIATNIRAFIIAKATRTSAKAGQAFLFEYQFLKTHNVS